MCDSSDTAFLTEEVSQDNKSSIDDKTSEIPISSEGTTLIISDPIVTISNSPRTEELRRRRTQSENETNLNDS